MLYPRLPLVCIVSARKCFHPLTLRAFLPAQRIMGFFRSQDRYSHVVKQRINELQMMLLVAPFRTATHGKTLTAPPRICG